MTASPRARARTPIRWRVHGFKGLLRLARRRCIDASVDGLMAGIAQTRRAGPARPTALRSEAVDVPTHAVGTCEVYTLRPTAPPSGRVVLHLHGGASCRPITRHHGSLLKWRVADERCTVVVPLYPLAPESTCVDTVRAVREIHAWTLERHGRVDTFVDDSAGAGLCLAPCRELQASGGSLPGRLVLITPWVDVTLTHADIRSTKARDPMLGVVGLREAGRLYAGALGVERPLVSPLRADLRGLPPTQVRIGTDDILHHDAVAFADQTRAAGCSVEVHVGAGMVHAWPLLPLPEARDARLAIGRFLRR